MSSTLHFRFSQVSVFFSPDPRNYSNVFTKMPCSILMSMLQDIASIFFLFPMPIIVVKLVILKTISQRYNIFFFPVIKINRNVMSFVEGMWFQIEVIAHFIFVIPISVFCFYFLFIIFFSQISLWNDKR